MTRRDDRAAAAREVERRETEVVARARAGGYAMVGVSGRTWSVDPATGRPTAPVAEVEYRTVRALMQREQLDSGETSWVRGADGQDWVVAPIVAADPRADPRDDPIDEARGAVDDIPTDTADADEMPCSGRLYGCCVPADEDGWSR